ncbi:MAG: two-component system cell cycle sensor histidine kinase PleC [Alphaproteobacteria bacterium]
MYAENSPWLEPGGNQRHPAAIRIAIFFRRTLAFADWRSAGAPRLTHPVEESRFSGQRWYFALVAAIAFAVGAAANFLWAAADGGATGDITRDSTQVAIPIFAIVAVLTFVVTLVVIAINQIKLIGEQLQTSEEQYELAASAIQGGLWHWDIANNEEYYSPHWLAILGFTDEDISNGLAVSEIHPDDSERARQALREHLETKVPYNIEIRLRHNSGEYIWVQSKGQAVWDDDGKPVRMAGSISEISHIMRAETAFRRSQDQMRAISDNSPSLMYMKDTESRLVMVNRAFQKFYGTTEEEALGENMGKWLSPDNAELFFALDQKILTTGKPQETRFDVLRHDGKTRPMLSTEFPVFDHEHNIIGIGGIDNDVFERKRAEDNLLVAMDAAESANHAKSEFMANMSHELRTPLNAIIGFSEIMAGEIFGPMGSNQYRDYAQDINTSGTHLLEIINNMLDLSKIEANKFELQEQTVHVPHAVMSCVTLVQGRAEKQGVKIQTVIADKSPYLYCDERGLKQVLLNLMTNAVKFTPEGGSLTVETWSNETDGYVFRFRDTGMGIAAEDIPMVLTPFGQVESAISRLQQGTGLGLPLTKSIVELHGGSFELQSEVGVGTTVTVSFPAQRSVKELAATGT